MKKNIHTPLSTPLLIERSLGEDDLLQAMQAAANKAERIRKPHEAHAANPIKMMLSNHVEAIKDDPTQGALSARIEQASLLNLLHDKSLLLVPYQRSVLKLKHAALSEFLDQLSDKLPEVAPEQETLDREIKEDKDRLSREYYGYQNDKLSSYTVATTITIAKKLLLERPTYKKIAPLLSQELDRLEKYIPPRAKDAAKFFDGYLKDYCDDAHNQMSKALKAAVEIIAYELRLPLQQSLQTQLG